MIFHACAPPSLLVACGCGVASLRRQPLARRYPPTTRAAAGCSASARKSTRTTATACSARCTSESARARGSRSLRARARRRPSAPTSKRTRSRSASITASQTSALLWKPSAGGDTSALETQDWSGSVYFDRDRWRIGLGYETRDIEVPFTLTGPLGGTLRRTAEISGDSFSFDARVALAQRWRLYLGLAEHDYERDLNLLPRIATLSLLSTSTLTLANSFLDHERYVAVERSFGAVSLNVRLATDRSAIDDSKFDTREVAVLFPIGTRVDLEVNVGSGRSEFFDAGVYGGVLFLIYGR